MKDTRPIEQQVAELTPAQQKNLGRIFWAQILFLIVAVAIMISVSCAFYVASENAHDVMEAIDQKEDAMKALGKIYYNAEESAEYFDAMNEYYDMQEAALYTWIVGGLLLSISEFACMVIIKNKFPYYSEKKYLYVKKHGGAENTAQPVNGIPESQSKPVAEGIAPTAPPAQYPMKWFKFLIYFALFFGAFCNFVFGLNYITGGVYFVQSDGEISAEMIYSVFGYGLKVVDVILGVLMVAAGGFGIYTRFRLSKFRSNGPLCVYLLYGSTTVLTILYSIAVLALTGENLIFSGSTIASVTVSICMVGLNYQYLSNRESLFVN